MSHKISKLLQNFSKEIEPSEVRILVAHVLKKSREFLITHPEYKLSKLQNWKIKRLIKKRIQGIPVAYLTGHKEFFGLDFLINKHTLVPRPETEVLVEEVLKELQQKNILIDVGTGSGCIPISMLKTINSPITTYATDISSKALKIAKKNASKHLVKINFFKGNLLEPLIKNRSSLITNCSVIITANLPYLTQEQFDSEFSIQHEPRSALIAEDNGLALYKKLIEQIQHLRTAYDVQVTTFFEIDPSQTIQLSRYIQSQFPKTLIKIIKDGMGNDRVAHIIIDKSNHA